MGNILCCIKPRDSDDIQYPNETSKSDKKNKDRSDAKRSKENEDSRNPNLKKNRHKNFKNQQQEMPKKNIIDSNFDTFNANPIESKKKVTISNNKNNNLRDIKEEEDDELETERELNNFSKAKASNINNKKSQGNMINHNSTKDLDETKNNSKAADSRRDEKKSASKNKRSNKDKEEIQYACDDEVLNTEFSKKTLTKLNTSDCSDVNSLDNSMKKDISDNKQLNTINPNPNVKQDNGLNAVKKVFPNKNYRLEIFIESFYLHAIDTDNFGPHFLPFLEILIGEEPVEKINIYKDQENSSKLDNSHNSNISDLDISYNMNQSYINNTKNNTAKNFLLRYYKSYLINSKNFYEADSNLIFSLKNGLLFKTTDNKNNANIPIITIGSESINLGKFHRTYKQQIFDGCLELKFRKSSIVGSLNLTVLITEEPNINKVDLEIQTPLFDEFIQNKNLDDFDDAVSQKSLNRNANLWKSNFIDSDEITNDLTADLFLAEDQKTNPSSVKNAYFKMVLKEAFKKNEDTINNYVYVNEQTGEVINEEYLRDLLVFECMKRKNKFAMLQLLNSFLNYFQIDNFDIFDRFLAILDEPQIQFLIEIHKLDDKNLLLYKYFLTLMDSYVLYHKNNQDESIRDNQIINQDVLLRSVFNILQNLKALEKKYDKIFKNYMFHYKECLLLAFNIIWDLCHEPEDLLIKDTSSKKSKQNLKETKKKEITTVYTNCLVTSTYRNLIVYLLNNFTSDSEVSGMIFKILRKSFQILIKDSVINTIDIKVLSDTPEKIFEQLRQGILFNDPNNFFINATKLAMGKFNHYPEIQNNILLIIFSLLNKSNTNTVKKFIEIFDITTLSTHLDIYRCKLRNHAKEINNYHLNIYFILASHLIKQESSENTNNLIAIAHAIASFFDRGNKRYADFSNRKYVEIQIQDMILKIIAHLSRIEECCYILLKSEFSNDFISYINNFVSRRSDTKSETTNDRRSMTSLKNKDYILYITEKKKRKMNIEVIKKICYSIISSVCTIVLNFALQDNKIFDEFAIVLQNYNIGDSDSLVDTLESCIKILDNYQVKTEELYAILNKIKDNFIDGEENEEEDQK